MKNEHLTHQQLCDLLIDSTPNAASAAHLESCPACSAEFATLNSSLTNFRQASVNFAEHAIDHRPLLLPARRTRRFLAVPAYAAAAAALALAIFVPLHNSHTSAPIANNTPAANVSSPASVTESDEAMLDEINQDIAASVPAPMEPLANPTGSTR